EALKEILNARVIIFSEMEIADGGDAVGREVVNVELLICEPSKSSIVAARPGDDRQQSRSRIRVDLVPENLNGGVDIAACFCEPGSRRKIGVWASELRRGGHEAFGGRQVLFHSGTSRRTEKNAATQLLRQDNQVAVQNLLGEGLKLILLL